MNNDRVIALAQKFLNVKKIPFVMPGELGMVDNNRIEVIFLIPEAVDPNIALVEPPDVRVWVDQKTGEVELILRM